MINSTLLANNKSFLTESDLKESSSQKMKYGLQIEQHSRPTSWVQDKPLRNCTFGETESGQFKVTHFVGSSQHGSSETFDPASIEPTKCV